MRIGVIGVGVIGSALLEGLSLKGFEAVGVDKFKAKYQRPENWENLLKSEIVFVCVPTLTIDRMQDLTAVREVFSNLNEAAYQGVIALRCTVLPGTTDFLIDKYPNLKILHNPEFLTASNPLLDLMNQNAVLIGGRNCTQFEMSESAEVLKRFWKEFSPGVPVRARLPVESEMAKYMHNCFLATKVSFFNDMYELCQKVGADYDEAINLAHMIGQIGKGHSKVPGPDGKIGWGGMCFIKDMDALSFFCELKGVPAETLHGAIRGNNRRRS